MDVDPLPRRRPRAYQGTTQMVLSGPTSAVVTGHYVQDGRRIAISNALPWSFEQERISSFEIRKLNPDDTLVVDMSYDGDGAHADDEEASGSGGAGNSGADSEWVDFGDSRTSAVDDPNFSTSEKRELHFHAARQIRQASTPEDLAAARALFEEYAAWLRRDLLSAVQRGMASLPGL